MTRRTLQGQYSGFVTRAIAYSLDIGIISGTVSIVVWLLTRLLFDFAGIQVGQCAPIRGFNIASVVCNVSTWLLLSFIFGFPFFYYLFFWIVAGQTPGKRFMGLRIVRFDGKRMNLVSGIRRLFGYFVSMSSLGLGFLWILVDDRRQGLHDKIAGTCVVYSWEGRQDEEFLERFNRRLNRGKLKGQQASSGGEIQKLPGVADEVSEPSTVLGARDES